MKVVEWWIAKQDSKKDLKGTGITNPIDLWEQARSRGDAQRLVREYNKKHQEVFKIAKVTYETFVVP